MNIMTNFKEFNIKPNNLTNGLESFYDISFDSDVEVKNLDRIHINFPPEIGVLS